MQDMPMQPNFIVHQLLSGVIAMSLALSIGPQVALAQSTEKTVVAHRGASGYLPEHTLESKAMAYAMGADYIEQDVVMTKDDQLLVLHDITLERTTNVADRFPDRARADGRYYVVDFTLAEIQTLSVTEGFAMRDGGRLQIYPNRFPMFSSSFRVHTLAQEIELIQGLNQATGKDIGIYPEIKSPAFHLAAGKDLGRGVMETLKAYGYTQKEHKVFVQTFEFDELVRLYEEIQPALGIELKLVQLLDGGADNAWMQTAEGVARIAEYADGLGPEKGMIIAYDSPRGSPRISGLVGFAHGHDLLVHPYTFRLDPGHIPDYAEDFTHMLELFYIGADVDGLFTDFPDRAVEYLRTR